MTRAQRIDAACAGYIASDEPGATHRDGMALALDAALADVGGLDGLDIPTMTGRVVETVRELAASRSAIRADRDRLREALRDLSYAGDDQMDDAWCAASDALRESEAGDA